MNRQLAEKLQQARKSVGLSQIQAADSVGICRSKIISIENGEGNIDVSLLGKLAHLYGYSLIHFLDGDSTEDQEISFAFRATELSPEDSYIPSWGRRILLNIRVLEEICKEAGI
jgi:transcriptional regulator with XRE-family HTH domain